MSYYCQNLKRPSPQPAIRKTFSPIQSRQVSPNQTRTPNVKVDSDRASTSKAPEYKQKGNTFDICSGRGPNSSSALFEKRRQLSRKDPKFSSMSLEAVDKYVKHTTPQVHVKPVVKARSKSPIKVEQPKAEPEIESVNPNIYQKKTLSKQQLWKPRV